MLGAGTCWGAAGVGLWMVVAWRYDLDLLLVAASFLLVGAAVLPLRSGLLVRVLRWRPLAALGVASYSLYLWHYPIVEHLSKAPPPPRLPKAAGYGAEARARSTTMPAADGSAGPPAICAATSWNGPRLVPVTV